MGDSFLPGRTVYSILKLSLSYEGGELVIEGADDEKAYSCEAGAMILSFRPSIGSILSHGEPRLAVWLDTESRP